MDFGGPLQRVKSSHSISAWNQQPTVKRLRVGNDPSKVCCSSESSDLVLRGINEQRQKGLFCDVVLVVGDASFPAHRSVLAASSEYFNSMFTLGMQESYQKEVKLIGASANGLKAVLDFLYGSELSLDSTIVDCILKTAHLLQIGKLVDFCCQYLKSELNIKNFLRLQELASIYSLEHLDSSIDLFILKYFGDFALKSSFVKRVPVEKLCLYLDSDRVKRLTERGLLRVALNWLKYSPDRAKEADRVLQNIRFSLIPESDLVSLAKPAIDSLALPQHMNCQSFVEEAIHYHSNVTVQPVLQNRRSTLRGYGEQLLFLGGGNHLPHQAEDSDVCFLDPWRGKWIPETQLPARCRDWCVAVLGNYVFCAGGYAVVEDMPNTSNMVYRYDPRSENWSEVAPMNHCRETFYLAALEDKLFAVGGTWTGHGIHDSVEMYSPQKNSWSFVAALPRPVSCHAGTTHKQRMYISGGVSQLGGSVTNTLLCYNHRTRAWKEKMHMRKARQYHGMCTLNDRIYAIGGNDGLHQSALVSVECYNPVRDQWTRIAPLQEPTFNAGVAVWKDKIYVLGGMSNMYNTLLKRVQIYMKEEKSWGCMTDLPKYMFGVAACVCVVKSKSHQTSHERPGLVSVQ